MSRGRAEVVVAIIVAVMGLLFVAASVPIYAVSIGAGPGAGVFPFWVGVGQVVFGIAYLVNTLRSPAPERFTTANRNQLLLLVVASLSMIGYLALMPFLGFMVTSLLFVAFHLRFVAGFRAAFSALCAVAVVGLATYAFEVWFYIGLPRGLVGW